MAAWVFRNSFSHRLYKKLGLFLAHEWRKDISGWNFINKRSYKETKERYFCISVCFYCKWKSRVAIFQLSIFKVASMSPFGVDLGFHVVEYAGSKGEFPPRRRRGRCSIYIATIEKVLNLILKFWFLKASMLVNNFISENRTDEIGLVVVDELHMIFENTRRSGILEILLSKLKYCFRKIPG